MDKICRAFAMWLLVNSTASLMKFYSGRLFNLHVDMQWVELLHLVSRRGKSVRVLALKRCAPES